MSSFRDDMCKCTDTPCAQAVAERLTQWAQEMSKSHAEPPPMSEADTKHAEEIGQAMGACMQKFGPPPAH